MKLICLHHAGGSSLWYYTWTRLLTGIKVIPIDLPGHGKKIQEPLIYNYNDAVKYLFINIQNIIEDGEDYIFFGHSMGGEMLLYILDLLEKNNEKLPLYTILSGICLRKKNRFEISKATKSQIIAKVVELGGIPIQIIGMTEFERYYLPVIKADFAMLEFIPIFYRESKFKSRAVIFNGKEDKIALDSEEEIVSFFEKDADVYHFDGGHFYLYSELEKICQYINELLEK